MMSYETGYGGPADTAAIEARGVGRKYRRGWALRDCSFRLPAGRICGLVGPNGAGKTTLMAIAANLLEPTTGTLHVFGAAPESAEATRRIAFLAQEKPLFRRFTVAETLRMGRELNPGWDQRAAENIVRAGNVPFDAKIGTLSGGQRTRVAFAVSFGKRPDLLLLDEPMSDLDPLVRHELMGTLLAEATERGTTVLMSTHMLAELENTCDYLLVIAGGGLRLAGEVDELRSAHAVLTGAHVDGRTPQELAYHTVVETRTSGRQFTSLVRPDGPVTGPWEASTPNLEELLLAYLRSPEAPPLISPSSYVGPQAVAA
ncbi:ABC transporter ATP-binding protein [Streptomyces europaeiscabiei]|uniref:ABC transporter ATP-binding protein n=1 Tax=Streptomyces europaeiscabiei TaxID=146819 RepID=UPI0029A72C10|nr:ABC transporter ATP-binding protein [Streptomyces europaeiscabiei]MDX3665903.1 ABC transporter ATP-binding protein [Streptomyces europaeiscabiei]MDX3714278.1 ABC transporter ATP-binding protein [Streptomyces europaeiscabiei]MDX3861797.1 ABC transporter ATP-binding protein [Streptomyces europaeiscabiei]